MGSFIDLTGKRFGRLIVVGRDYSKNRHCVFWLCKCDCGKITSVSGGNLRSLHTQSCGCLRNETEAKHFLSHDHVRKDNPRLYSIWKSMRRRCYDKRHQAYHCYGARGIGICDDWLGDSGFCNFAEWALENGYENDLTIDRIDFNQNYSPNNCRWVSIKENANNKRTNRYIEYNNVTKTLAQWSELYGLRQCELKRRLDYLHLPIEIALTMPARPKTEYNGRMLCISNLAQRNHIDYRDFLIEIFMNKKSADELIREKGQQR